MEKNIKCCLCGEDAGKFGNNAQPLAEGSCCDVCNSTRVIPARLARLGIREAHFNKDRIFSMKFNDDCCLSDANLGKPIYLEDSYSDDYMIVACCEKCAGNNADFKPARLE